MQWLADLVDYLINIIGVYGPILGSLLLCFESIIPVLPSSLFIAVNFLAFGQLLGFIMSWICVCLGCTLSFIIFRKGLKGKFENRMRKNETVNKLMNKIDKMKYQNLVLLIAMPFTPAFAVNIAAGLSKMEFKKFISAILLSKIFMVYFFGYVGTTLYESITNPVALIKVLAICVIAYVISYILNKKLKLD